MELLHADCCRDGRPHLFARPWVVLKRQSLIDPVPPTRSTDGEGGWGARAIRELHGQVQAFDAAGRPTVAQPCVPVVMREAAIRHGAFLNEMIAFVIVGFFMFVRVKTYNRATARAEVVVGRSEVGLLTEIRDGLRGWCSAEQRVESVWPVTGTHRVPD